MKKTFSIAFILFFVVAVGASQQVDRALAFAPNNQPGAVISLASGNWLTIVASDSVFGGLNYFDGLFAVVFDTAGQVVATKALSLPSYVVEDLEPTLDSGFVLSARLMGCDFGTLTTVLQKFDKHLKPVWRLSEEDMIRLPTLIEVGPDGNLIGTDSYRFYKIDQSTGKMIWQTSDIYIPVSGNQEIGDFKLLPTTEDIVAVGKPFIQLWQKSEAASVSYHLIHGYSLSNSLYNARIERQPSGQNFFIEYGQRNLYRYTDLNDINLLKTYPFDVYDLAATNQNLFLLVRSENTTMLLKSNLEGDILDTLSISNRWFFGTHLAKQQDNFAVVGLNGSGPEQVLIDWKPYTAQSLWLRAISDKIPPTQSDNAALVGVSQNAPLTNKMLYTDISTGDTIYQVKGGNFKVQVKNAGSTVLESVDVVTMLDWNEFGICYTRPAKRQHYFNLGLTPGDSVWLNFGDIQAQRHLGIPDQVCFWVSIPNDRPDQKHDDDIYCKTVDAVSQVENPLTTSIRLFPNPAGATIQVESPIQQPGYQIIDLFGRILNSTEIPIGQLQFEIPVAHLPNGMYWVRFKDFQEKIVVMH